MSLLTTRLGIKKPQDPDTFQTSDFQNNYDLIDSYPGVFVCTSSTKPSWGSAQTGQLIFCTDTKAALAWTGSAWVDPLTLPASWLVSTTMNATLTAGSPTGTVVGSYTVGTISSTRACNATFVANVDFEVTFINNEIAFSYQVLVNGTPVTTKGGSWASAAISVSGATVFQGNPLAPASVTAFGTCSLQAGSNTIAVAITSQSLYANTGNAAPVLYYTASVALNATDSTNT